VARRRQVRLMCTQARARTAATELHVGAEFLEVAATLCSQHVRLLPGRHRLAGRYAGSSCCCGSRRRRRTRTARAGSCSARGRRRQCLAAAGRDLLAVLHQTLQRVLGPGRDTRAHTLVVAATSALDRRTLRVGELLGSERATEPKQSQSADRLCRSFHREALTSLSRFVRCQCAAGPDGAAAVSG
jgi:hypothetical protein